MWPISSLFARTIRINDPNQLASTLPGTASSACRLQNERVVPVFIFPDRGHHPYELHLGGDRHTYLSFQYISCELKNRAADDYRQSDNIVARLNLPNMRYAKEQKLDIYHDAQLGLVQLEPDPKKQLKYIDFVDYYTDLTEDEIETYRKDYLSEAEARMGLAQI